MPLESRSKCDAEEIYKQLPHMGPDDSGVTRFADLDILEETVIKWLEVLKAGFHALRTVWESTWLEQGNADEREVFVKSVRTLFRLDDEDDENPLVVPSEVRDWLNDVSSDDVVLTSWFKDLQRLAPEQRLDVDIVRRIGAALSLTMTEFENSIWRKLPQAFAKQVLRADRRTSTKRMHLFRKVWALWLYPCPGVDLSGLGEGVRAEIEENGCWPVRRWDQMRTLLVRPELRPAWYDVDKVIRHTRRICRSFRKQGRRDLRPTRAEILQVAVAYIRKLTPPAARELDDDELKDRLEGLRVGNALHIANLKREIFRRLGPAVPDEEAVDWALHCAEHRGLIRLCRISKDKSIYLSSHPSAKQTPFWNADASELWYRGRQCWRFVHRSDNIQRRLLETFEKGGWPPEVDSPLVKNHGTALHAAVEALNHDLAPYALHLDVIGGTASIRWHDVRASEMPGNTPEVSAAPHSPTAPDRGFYSAGDLATRHKVKAEPLRKRLERWRKKRFGSDDWTEQADRANRAPRFLYRESAVADIVRDSPPQQRPSIVHPNFFSA